MLVKLLGEDTIVMNKEVIGQLTASRSSCMVHEEVMGCHIDVENAPGGFHEHKHIEQAKAP
jgi:hypothetical protein